MLRLRSLWIEPCALHRRLWAFQGPFFAIAILGEGLEMVSSSRFGCLTATYAEVMHPLLASLPPSISLGDGYHKVMGEHPLIRPCLSLSVAPEEA